MAGACGLSRGGGASIDRGVKRVRLAILLCCGILAFAAWERPVARALTAAPPGTRPAKGKLLVAAADQEDPHFAGTVILLVAYGADEGAMGVIINQPTPIKLATILPELPQLARRQDKLWRGGPVLPTSVLTLVRSKKALPDSEPVVDDVRMLTSRKAFERTLRGDISRDRIRAFAGHAGWGPGQLEGEIARGDWIVMPATGELVFSTAPDGVWRKLMERGQGEWTSRDLPAYSWGSAGGGAVRSATVPSSISTVAGSASVGSSGGSRRTMRPPSMPFASRRPCSTRSRRATASA
jgi:putative transcriptional regulator